MNTYEYTWIWWSSPWIYRIINFNVHQSPVSQWLLQWKFRKAFGLLNCLSPFALHCPNFYRHRQGRGGWWVQGPNWRYTYFKMPRIEDVDLKLVGLRFGGWYLSLRVVVTSFATTALCFRQHLLIEKTSSFIWHGSEWGQSYAARKLSEGKSMEHQAWILGKL